MQTIWNSRIDEVPLETIFLNGNLKILYAAENRTSAIMSASTAIALVISSLGLHGLSAYVAERKTREIGIRKVVGASPANIVRMLSKEYLKLILISFIISIPIGYYFMEKWLEGFAYRTTAEAWLFLISCVVFFIIAWITVSFESYRAALKDPVRSLRTE
jgi:putative ABC transport system permease protein